MSEKAVNDAANKQRDFITFTEQVLEVCCEFKSSLDAGYIDLSFCEKGTDCWHGIQEEDWVNKLFACVFDAIVNKTCELEIRLTDKVSLGKETKQIEISKDFFIVPSMHSSKDCLAKTRIHEVIERLQSGFVDSGVVWKLKEDSESFFSARQKILPHRSVFHLERKDIESYLNKYYELLLDLILFYDAFDQDQDRDTIIGELLRLDTEYNEKTEIYEMDSWSPMVLNKLQKVNNGIADFFYQITKGAAAESEWLQKIYKQIVLIKIQHEFRWYMAGEDKKLIHAAFAPYVDDLSRNLNFQVVARSLTHYNSYEGIGELRLGEKIIYEYNLIKNSVGSEFRVAILGDLHAEPVAELYDYVDKKIEKPDGEFALKFYIYTKNEFEKSNNTNIICQKKLAKVLLRKTQLEQVIDTNHIVFILDCVELYKSPVLQPDSHEFVKHRFGRKFYGDSSMGREKADICARNMLDELYENLTCEQVYRQFGRITKKANESLLEYCEEKQYKAGEKSTIYVYVSDMQAFDEIYHDDQYYIRTERYNQKEIGIIRYSSEMVTKLRVGNQKNKMLVFSMWQFIKNVAIKERNMFFFGAKESDSDYMALDHIYIGIDYRDWPNLLEVHYYCEENLHEEKAQRFIKEILLPVLNNHTGDMFLQYIRKAMYSFFFSAAKSVNDMLFAHLFLNKESLLGEVVRAEKNNPDKVKDNINLQYKFSSKRFYDMIMKNYDMSSNMYVGQIRTSQIIQRNEERENRIKKDEVYQNVMKACKNLEYEDTYLMKNCELELSGRY